MRVLWFRGNVEWVVKSVWYESPIAMAKRVDICDTVEATPDHTLVIR